MKSFKQIEQSPQLNTIFHELLNISCRFFDGHLSKLETSDTKTEEQINNIKEKLQELNNDLMNLLPPDEENLFLSKSKKEPNTLKNEIKQYIKKREKSLERQAILLPYELSTSPDKHKHLATSPQNNLNHVSSNKDMNNPNTLKNSSSYKEFKQMMGNTVAPLNEKKSPPPQKIKNEEEDFKEVTPRNKAKPNKKMYQYYFANNNEKKINEFVNQARNNKETNTNNKQNKKEPAPRKNTNIRKKEAFQKELAKNYTVLASKSKEKLINNDGVNGNHEKNITKPQNLVKKSESSNSNQRKIEENYTSEEESSRRNFNKNKKQESMSCDRYKEEMKMKNSSSKFLNYYYFFDKKKEMETIGEN